MDSAGDFVAAQRRNDPLDLAPVAEASEVSIVATTLRPSGSLETCIIAVVPNEVRGISERNATVNEDRIHPPSLSAATVERLRTIIVNKPFTISGLGSTVFPCHGRPMQTSTRAGGCFLTICILAGFPLGLAIGNPMKGVLIGTGVGIALAVLTWLIDYRRGR